jgi:hypothetical protein
MARSKTADARLAGCHGYAVAAREGPIGSVETPVFPEAGIEPDYLLVRTAEAIPGTFRVVPAALIRTVDPAARTIVLAADLEAVASLPEQLPRERRRRAR